MKSQSIRLSKVQRRQKLFASKKFQQRDVYNYMSHSSTDEGIDDVCDSCDELVCTNCVETDYYLAQFCNELLYSPSSAMFHLEGVINNPEFPKDDLYLSGWKFTPPPISVPITTYTCLDCNPQDLDFTSHKVNELQLHSESNHSPEIINVRPGNYDKERRGIERDLINSIYELVRDQHIECNSSSVKSSSRITKLSVSEMAIQRMENIKKINYNSQIERIKYKLLQSYRAFARLDRLVRDVAGNPILSTMIPPYRQKIRDLEKSLQIHSS